MTESHDAEQDAYWEGRELAQMELRAEIERLRAFVNFIADGGDENSDYDQFVWLAKQCAKGKALGND